MDHFTHKWHICMSHVTDMNDSFHTYGWVMSHTWASHVTRMSRHTYECVMSHIRSEANNIWECLAPKCSFNRAQRCSNSRVFNYAAAAKLGKHQQRVRKSISGFFNEFICCFTPSKRGALIHINWLAPCQLLSSQHHIARSDVFVKTCNVRAWSLRSWHLTHKNVEERLCFFLGLISNIMVTPTVHWGFVNKIASLRKREYLLLNAFGWNRVDSETKLLITSFAAESGQIRKNRTFSNLRGLNLCTSHILVFGCLHGQDVMGS